MNIALIGYGKMGKAIEEIAIERGHNIVEIIEKGEDNKFEQEKFLSCDIVIEFTSPSEAYNNCSKCFDHNKPVISGTTGWDEQLRVLKSRCITDNQTIFHSSNFSIGMNIFFEINKKLSRLMNGLSQYEASMQEVHHKHKLDSPSGTAITLAEGLIQESDKYKEWTIENNNNDDNILHIDAVREGEVPGIHKITYKSKEDEISIRHEAFSRRGFALGAVLAAEYTKGNRGVLTMEKMLNK